MTTIRLYILESIARLVNTLKRKKMKNRVISALKNQLIYILTNLLNGRNAEESKLRHINLLNGRNAKRKEWSRMNKENGSIIASWDFSKGIDVGVLIIAKQERGKNVEIVNAFQGQEAYDLMKKLTGKPVV